MMKQKQLISAAFGLLLITALNYCKKSACETQEVSLTLNGIEWAQLDNRTGSPKVLLPGQAGYKNAYGFQLTADPALVDSAAAAGIECPFYNLSPRITGFDIITLTGLGDEVAPGGSVANYFAYVSGSSSGSVSGAAPYLSTIWSNQGERSCIFLLTLPPVDTGWQQLEIRLQYSDLSLDTLVMDPIFLQ